MHECIFCRRECNHQCQTTGPGRDSTEATAICENGTITVRIVSSQAGVNYQVFDQGATSRSGVIAGTGSNLDIITSALPTGTTDLTVTATNPTTSCLRVLTATVSGIVVTPTPVTPVISNVGALTTQCEGTVSLTLNSDGAGTAHQWYKDGAIIIGANANSYAVPDAVASSGTYTVTTSTAGPTCTSAFSAGVNVIINARPLDQGVTAQTGNSDL